MAEPPIDEGGDPPCWAHLFEEPDEPVGQDSADASEDADQTG